MISSSSGASRLCELRSVVSRSNSLIPHLGHHAGLHVVEIVAVESPTTRIIGVEGDPHPSRPGHDQHGVAHGIAPRPVSDNRIARRLSHWFALACSQNVHLSGYPS